MAKINLNGGVIARCHGCNGALTSFAASDGHEDFGNIRVSHNRHVDVVYRLMKCLGCGSGALAVYAEESSTDVELIAFYPKMGDTDPLPLPSDVPEGITLEFREGEKCLQNGCYRAAAGMFRSVLDKTLRANGYKLTHGTRLDQQIDAAAADGAITASRQRKAHDEIRVLGNDVLHDEWRNVNKADVEAARQYSQRILEDFYDDRESVLGVLRQKGRVPDEDRENKISTPQK